MEELKFKSLIYLLVLSLSGIITGCNKMDEASDEIEASNWYSNYDWSHDFDLVPHPSVNEEEFARQYKYNKELWDKSFEFLKTNNLDTISPGRYVIDEGNVTAFISEGEPNRLEQIKWETHDNFTDLQYIVLGKTLMGVASRSEGSVTEPYDSSRDVTFYDVEGDFYKSDSESFFLFFPTDIHRPAVRIEDYNEIKRVLIKIRSLGPE